MGELAERYRRWIDQPRSVSEGREMWAIFERIVALEERLADQSRIIHDLEVGVLIGKDGVRLEPSARIQDALQRATDAEQRADALLAAVSVLVQTGGKLAAIADVDRVSDVHDSHGWHCQMDLSNATSIPEFRKHGLRVAVIVPDSPPNPDLLERASVELAEEYQRVKAKEAANG